MTFTVAIMQPYFLPYAGYFRLLAQSDLFVIYDCVQFPRRGWVHRNTLTDSGGQPRWLTLPLKPAPQDVRIRDLQFADDAEGRLSDRLRPFDLSTHDPDLAKLVSRVRDIRGAPADYIVDLMEQTCGCLGIPWNVVRSSSLDIPASFSAQDRILEIARRVGAERYLNAPGGADLYDAASFAASGIELRFLPPYGGPLGSILERLLREGCAAMASELGRAP